MFYKKVTNRFGFFIMVFICISFFQLSCVYAGSTTGALGKFFWDWGAGGEGAKTLMRYGNWLGPGWWGGSESPTRVGMLPPIDDLDAIAQKHDFGYELAEKLGKGRPNVEAYYKALADFIAVCDTRDLPPDPRTWRHPARNPEQAKIFMDRLDTAFTYYQQKMHEAKAAIPTKIDKSNPDIPDEVFDSLIEPKEFEKRALIRIKEWEKTYAEFQKKKANSSTPAETGKNGHQKSGITAEGIDAETLKEICRCSTSCSAGAYYSTTPVKESPSCEDPGNGPCVCSGYGCMRAVMSPACIARVLQDKKGHGTSLNDVLQFIDNYEGKKQSVTDPSSIPPIIRKGEAFELNIKVPGKEPEKWLWRSDDAKTFQATRLTPGTGPATETFRLQSPSMGYLIFERSSTQDKILSVRDLMNGGFVDGISDRYPKGTTVAAYVIKDPNPSMPATSFPVTGTFPLFTKPDRIDASGSYGLFEPVTTPMTLKGANFSSYQLQHPGSSGPTSAIFKLNGNVSRFTAKAGIDQSLHPDVALGGGATVRITVSGDGRVIYQSGVIDRNTPLLNVDVGLQGVKEFVITVDDSGDGNAFDWLVWGDPVIK